MSELIQVRKWSEWCDGEDWKKADQEHSHALMPWDPACVLPARILACWVFCDGAILFVCGQSLGTFSLSSSKLETKRAAQGLFFKLARSVLEVCTSPQRPFHDAASHLMKSNAAATLTEPEKSTLQWMSSNCELFLLNDGDFRIVACLPREGVAFGTAADWNANRLVPDLALNFSRYLMKNPVAQLAPKCFFDLSCSAGDLLEYFWSPKIYRPGIGGSTWIWPWQRFSIDGQYKSEALTTTTLCADIRLSTTAMERTERKIDFAVFVRDAVVSMKDTLREHGGFFDKETGDGVVGHFIDGVMKRNGAVSAYRAAREMIVKVGRICDSFVDQSLSQSLPIGLGIGIHTGEAHWFASGNQINAIGSSVVDATRICEKAGRGEILLSLGGRRNLERCVSGERLAFKLARTIEFKGLSAPVLAYSMDV